MKKGFDDGFMIIQTNNSEDFVQFKKRIISKGKIVLFSHFFPAIETKKNIPSLIDYLNKRQISYDYLGEGDEKYIEIPCGHNIDYCKELVIGVNETEFWTGRKDIKSTIWYENVSGRNELIDSK